MKYLIRSVKYLLLLIVLYTAIMAVMYFTGTMAQPLADGFVETLRLQLLGTPRGWTMLAAVVALAAAYPRFGFGVRRVEGDLELHRTQVLNAMRACGFELVRDTGEELLFRGADPLKRLTLLFEDELRVSQYGQWIEIEGIRRATVRAAWRLEGYLAHLKEN
ncbi:hypothetical protein [uncultured Alistipes sp.]|uniref:hypothetical protein n=1 Tax=uncultured Alistipes sp. TaxID=538949 RepID=UPI0025FC7EAD|nr:hypothetical protein [uncultured Alistipes sp.]